MRHVLSFPAIVAGFVAVLVGYTSSVAIVLQAAEQLGASGSQTSSWLWVLGIGMGLTCILLSLFFKAPVLTAWSTPGAAVLATSTAGYSMGEAVGAMLLSACLVFLCGVTGAFERIIKHIPAPLAGAMLAGVLLPFGLKMFIGAEESTLLVSAMFIVYVVMRLFSAQYAVLVTLLMGAGVALLMNNTHFSDVTLVFAEPEWVAPQFSALALVGLGLPLFMVTMASQNVPGLSMLRSYGYNTPASPLMTVLGGTSFVLAPFGGFSFSLAAITAAICMSDNAGKHPETRYWSAVWAGVFYLVTGVLGATVVALFAAVPSALVVTIAALALVPTITNSLSLALSEPDAKESAVVTFMATASGFSLYGIGSAFWGMVLGVFVYLAMKYYRANRL